MNALMKPICCASAFRVQTCLSAALLKHQRHWSRWCEDKVEILKAAELIVAETDEEKLQWLLRLFSDKPFPGDLTRVIALTDHSNSELSSLAAAALEHAINPKVRELALKFASEQRHPRSAVAMLNTNFQRGDEKIVEEVVSVELNDFELHSVDFTVREFFKAHPEADCEATLLYLFEKNPCSLCRDGELEILLKAGKRIPERILKIAAWDCNSDTRESAQVEIKKSLHGMMRSNDA